MVEDFLVRKLTGEENEYVDLRQDATIELFTDTLELYRENNGQTIVVQGRTIEVGRNNSCDFVLTSIYTARRHATFFFENGAWFLRDNLSTNKTYINGKALEPWKKYKLFVGDSIAFGDEKYCFFKSRVAP